MLFETEPPYIFLTGLELYGPSWPPVFSDLLPGSVGNVSYSPRCRALFLFFEPGSVYVPQAGLELRSSCLSSPTLGLPASACKHEHYDGKDLKHESGGVNRLTVDVNTGIIQSRANQRPVVTLCFGRLIVYGTTRTEMLLW